MGVAVVEAVAVGRYVHDPASSEMAAKRKKWRHLGEMKEDVTKIPYRMKIEQ